MVRHATGAARPLPWRRVFGVLALAAALVIPFSYTFAQFWQTSGDDLEVIQDERAGVEYIRPLTKLIAVLADSQSAAIRGEQPNAGSLQGAAAAVANVDRRLGETLDTQERWSALSERITQITSRPVNGKAAFNTYSTSIDLAVALMAKVGDTSQLILDPQLDSYYLMDTTLLRLPALLVDSGRMVDLARLGRDSDDPAAVTQVFAARDRLAGTTAAIDLGLKKSFDVTESSTLGPSLLGHVDRLRSVSTELAPTTSLVDLPVSVGDADQIAAARDRLRDATIQLDDATLTELDALLRARQEVIDDRRTGVIVAMVIAALIGGALLWSRLPERVRPDYDDELTEPRHRRTEAEEQEAEAPDLIDARRLLSTGELVRVGRAVQPSRRERFRDDAE